MSLAEALTSGPKGSRKGPACSVGVALAALPESEAVALQALLDAPPTKWTAENISDELAEVGVEIQGQTIARHRRGGCRCESR